MLSSIDRHSLQCINRLVIFCSVATEQYSTAERNQAADALPGVPFVCIYDGSVCVCVCVCVLSVLQSIVHAFMRYTYVFKEAEVMIVNIMLLYYMRIGHSKFHTTHLATL